MIEKLRIFSKQLFLNSKFILCLNIVYAFNYYPFTNRILPCIKAQQITLMINYIFLFFILNLIFFIFLNKIAFYYNLYDLPDFKRKIHSKPTPLLGGLLIILNLCNLFN